MTGEQMRLRHAMQEQTDGLVLAPGTAALVLEATRRAKRRRLALGASGGFAVAAAAVVTVLLAGGHSSHRATVVPGQEPSPSPSAVGPVLRQGPLTEVPDTSGIAGVRAWKTVPTGAQGGPGEVVGTHTSDTVLYSVSPPVGGPHDRTWLNCGEYPTTPRLENAVHDLEHGAVWITYRPDLPASDLQALRAIYAAEPQATATDGKTVQPLGSKYLDLFPYSPQSSPIVLGAWGHQLSLESPSDPRLQQFIDTFRVSQTYTPEYGSPCTGGVGTPGTAPEAPLTQAQIALVEGVVRNAPGTVTSATAVVTHRKAAVSLMTQGDKVDSDPLVALVDLRGTFTVAGDMAAGASQTGPAAALLVAVDLSSGQSVDSTGFPADTPVPAIAALGPVTVLPLP